MRSRDPDTLLESARAGDPAALARLLSIVERGGGAAREVGRRTHPRSGSAHTIGVTGAPGAGKSTLTDQLIGEIRARGDTVAVLCVDPSSPFSGGAILGDRVRMQSRAVDDGVFIRSMATRGHLGGLALAAPEAIRLLDAAGRPWIVVETVGVGQVEVEIAGEADTTVVVVTPGWGDAVQASKAGLLEVADVFAVNKADRPGVGDTRRDLESMLELSGERGWRPPIVATVAADGTGVEELWEAVLAHRRYLHESGELARRRARRLGAELRSVLTHRLRERVDELCSGDAWARVEADVLARRTDPYTAADRLLADLA